jgi:hypothetical protein
VIAIVVPVAAVRLPRALFDAIDAWSSVNQHNGIQSKPDYRVLTGIGARLD